MVSQRQIKYTEASLIITFSEMRVWFTMHFSPCFLHAMQTCNSDLIRDLRKPQRLIFFPKSMHYQKTWSNRRIVVTRLKSKVSLCLVILRFSTSIFEPTGLLFLKENEPLSSVETLFKRSYSSNGFGRPRFSAVK